MELSKRIVLAMAVMFTAFLSVTAFLIFYGRAHHGLVPASISLLMPAFILCASLVAFVIVRKGRPRETPDLVAGLTPHISWMRVAIKTGLVIYVLGLLNGIRLVAENAIPIKYALVGFTICIALIVAHWKALKRLDKIKSLATAPGTQVK